MVITEQKPAKTEKIRLLIIDEQAYFRAGVRQALASESDFEILDCDPSIDVLALIDNALPNVALLGSDLASHSGLELSREIARHFPNTKVIMLSPNPNDEELFEIIRSAAVACVGKNTIADELIGTIRRAHRGEYPINDSVINRPKIASQLLNRFQDMSTTDKTLAPMMAPLTQRETQILNNIATGKSNKQIAYLLGIGEQTIKNHVSAILRKLNANDRAHAVALAMRSGLVATD